ncbi:MAG: cell wall hydrolase [Angelakisella sp.]|jgi:N-acetylmuramoyl-L-alanine amidase|nr:cell wall hydrolase [Angelakisella sp.]
MKARCKKFAALALGGIAAGGAILGALAALDRTLESRVVGLPTTTRPVVILDPGHGGMDGGAEGNNITEKNVNLAIAHKVREYCTLFGFQVEMTRETDISIHDEGKKTIRAQKNSDLKNRLKIMTANPSAVAVSIHLNKFPQSRIKGAQVFYAPKSPGSEELAQTIQDNFRGLLQPENTRQIKKADSSLFLLYNNTVTPAVLVECGFLSNPEEAALLASEDYQDRVAFAICCSLLEFYDGSFEEETPDDPSKA